MKPRFSWFSLAFACMMCFTIGIAVRPAWAATATLEKEVGENYIDERAIVYVDSTNSWLTSVKYNADLLGVGPNNMTIAHLMLPGQNTYVIPGPNQWMRFGSLPAGYYNVYVIAYGYNTVLGSWAASSGGEIVYVTGS